VVARHPAFVTHPGNNDVSVIDTASETVVDTMVTGVFPTSWGIFIP
jgi:YVTN family beta-propeller protein